MTIGLIVSAYTTASVATAFVGASAMFGAAAVYGAVTKRELSGIGGYLFIALIGILAASLINIFLASSGLTWVISIIGVILFTVLTAYDVQRIKAGNLAAATGSMEKAAVMGALSLPRLREPVPAHAPSHGRPQLGRDRQARDAGVPRTPAF